MPKLKDNQDLENHRIAGSNFGFSATRIDSLGAMEYTLGTIVVDVSGSVQPYKNSLEKCLKEIVAACCKNPRADNMMLRVVLFNGSVNEVHGFKPLPDCNEDDYTGIIKPYGCTALFDATYSSVMAMNLYGKELAKQDFSVNAVLFVLTDGDDNNSTMTKDSVRKAMEEAVRGEYLESLMSVLVGVNVDSGTGLNQYLENFKNEAGFQQYVAIDKADAQSLSKLADFISRSFSSQSNALNPGGPSKSLSF